MTDLEDDDVFTGEGFPTTDQILRIRSYLRRHNRIHAGIRAGDERGVRPTFKEAKARGFKMSLATIQRVLIAADLGEPVRPKQSDKRGPRGLAPGVVSLARATMRAKQKGDTAPPFTLADLKLLDPSLVATMKTLLEEENTSTSLAIRENRVRMALNIIIAERMAAKPDVLLVDMRSTAALVDALTIASKLSGGASIDIHVPTVAEMRAEKAIYNGTMKDVTPVVPKSALAIDFELWRKKRADGGKTS
jgi:hypothetical protein